MQKELRNILGSILVVILVTMVANSNEAYSAIKYVLYVVELFLIAIMYVSSRGYAKKLFQNPLLLICLFIILCGMIVFDNHSNYSNIIKYVGYVVCFGFGKALSYKRIQPPRIIILSLILAPLLIVGLADHTLNQSRFFPNSNTFTYWGLCCSIMYFTLYKDSPKVLLYSFSIVLAYIGVGTSLGIFSAFVLAVFINRRNFKLMLGSGVLGLILIGFVFWSDIAVFVRIRNVLEIFRTMTWQDWTHLSELNLYDLQQESNVVTGDNMRSDNTSAIWRFAHWSILLKDYFSNITYGLFVGLGDNYSTYNHSLPPHNEWLRLLIEYGAIVFISMLKWTRKFCNVISKTKVYYLFLTVIIYHITENLIDAFPSNCLMYISAGFWYQICKTSTYQKKNVDGKLI